MPFLPDAFTQQKTVNRDPHPEIGLLSGEEQRSYKAKNSERIFLTFDMFISEANRY